MPNLTLYDQNNLRTVVEYFFGKQNTLHWNMNESLLLLITTMLNESRTCSEAMDFVPRPGVYLSPNDVKKELKRMAERAKNKNNSYYICNIFVVRQYRTKAELAACGLY